MHRSEFSTQRINELNKTNFTNQSRGKWKSTIKKLSIQIWKPNFWKGESKKYKVWKPERIIVPSSSATTGRVDSSIYQAKWIYSTSRIIYSYLSRSIEGFVASILPNQASFHALCVTLRADIHCPSVFIYPKRFRCVLFWRIFSFSISFLFSFLYLFIFFFG